MARRAALALVVAAAVTVAGVSAYVFVYQPSACGPYYNDASKYVAQKTTFGGVTEYCLARPTRWSNAIVVGPDGSVWFGEEALPGLGRLYQNGTVVEYPWTFAETGSGISGWKTGIWSVVSWNGGIWATDGDGNMLVGLDPTSKSLTMVNSSSAPFPYVATVAPGGSLWFTSLSSPPKLAMLSENLTLSVYRVAGTSEEEPIQVQFVNSTYAYMVALDPYSEQGEGGLYSFDPQATGGTIEATRVGGNFTLFDPDGLALEGGSVWVTEHGPSTVAGYDLEDQEWTLYPTSTVPYVDTTLPYFVDAAGGTVWFNEHYANKIARFGPNQTTLTEFSEADPEVTNGSQVQNDLTIAADSQGVWFTSTTGNYIGFVNASYVPSFSISGAHQLYLNPGAVQNVTFEVSGSWQTSLKVVASDSENFTGELSLIHVTPSTTEIPAGNGPYALSAAFEAADDLAPGRYTVAFTVTNGLVWQTSYVFVDVG